jgi:alkylhydroperoxidase family enzyme
MIPRLPAGEWPKEVADALRPRIERLGYVGEFFTCGAHQPAALVSFMTFTEDLKRALPNRLTEVVALTVSTELENAYERHQHERLCLKLGFDESWVRAVEALDPSSVPALADAERAVQTLTLAMIRRHGKQTSRELDAVVDAVGAAQAVAVMMQVGRYVTHALMVNTLDLAPPVPSPLGTPGPT